MATKKRLLAIVFALFAATFALMPACAFADDVTVITADMVKGGTYTIGASGNYKFDDGLTGVKELVVNCGGAVDLDLNGCTVTADSAGCVTVRKSTQLTLHNGYLTQTNSSHAGVRIEGGSTVNMSDLTVSCANHVCIDVEDGTANISGGTYTTTNTGSSSAKVVHTNYGYANISGGTFTSTNAAGVTHSERTSHIAISGGSFSAAPDSECKFADDDTNTYAILYNSATGNADVDSKDSVLESAQYYVSASGYMTVYFADEESANAYASKYGAEVIPAKVTVTFDTDGGSEAPASQTIAYGEKATKPETDPTKDNNVFQYWALNGSKYDFSGAVKSNITLKAVWKYQGPVCKIGDTTYTSLQDAINAVQDGQTIVLIDDVSECVTAKEHTFTIDLGGKTLTNGGNNDTLSVTGTANITLKNGAMSASWNNCAVYLYSSNAAVTVQDGVSMTISDGSWAAAINVDEGNLTINGGTFSVASGDTIRVYGGSVIINDGAFTCSNSNDEYSAVYVCGDDDSPKVTINGGTFSSKESAVYADEDSEVVINGGTFTSEEYFALDARYSTVTINGGTFTTEDEATPCVAASFADMTINGGTFGSSSTEGGIALAVRLGSDYGSLNISDGDFYGDVVYDESDDDFTAVASGGTYSLDGTEFIGKILEEGKVFFCNAQSRVKIVDEADAKASACKVLRFTYDNNQYVYYFEDASKAEEFYDEIKGAPTDVTIHSIYHVTFKTKGETVATADCEEGESVGELPEAGTIEGYDFVGWYVDGKYADENKVTADYVPTSDLTVKSMWLAKGSDEGVEPTDDPSDEGGKSDDKGSDKAMPQTGDVACMAAGVAAAGAALAGAGALRRRK